MMALRLVMRRAGVGFPLVIVISRNSEYRITIPHGAVLIHHRVHVNHPAATFHLTIRTRVIMKRYVYSLGAVMLLGCCTPALAQRYYAGPDYTPANWYFAGGYTAATGEAANFVDNGWNIGTGVQWRPHPGPISLRVDLEYSR